MNSVLSRNMFLLGENYTQRELFIFNVKYVLNRSTKKLNDMRH